MKFIYWILDWLFDTDNTLNEFEKHFPGRCPICAHDRAARMDGVSLKPINHYCPEKTS